LAKGRAGVRMAR